jgi:ubiquinone/menaquinone biosynthesis C-methylase UbiE
MDGQSLDFENEVFDKVILHLILAVIPDPIRCIKEVERVLKKGGEIAVFDKFVRKGRKLSFKRNILNPVTNLLFSDITRDFYTIINHTQLTVTSDTEANLNGNFRRIKASKKF